MPQARIEGDLIVTGTLVPTVLNIPSATVLNATVQAAAGIAASKLEHQYEKAYSQPNTAATDETRVVHVVHGATGEILEFEAGSIAKAVGDATCTVDLQKNGVSVLSAVITLDSGNTNYVPESGTISSADVVAGDVLSIVIDGTIGTGTLPTGVFCSVKLREDAD